MFKNYCKVGLLGVSLLCSSTLVAEDYKVGNGVPDPINTWAPNGYVGDIVHPITGKAPANWAAANEQGLLSYYVDSSHPDATNTNNEFGSPDKPRKTIMEGTYAAGAYVEIHGGPYDGGGQLIITADGTPDKPVWIRGVDQDNRAIISGETIIKGQYVILENLEYNLPKKNVSFRSHNGSNLHHAVIRNSVFRGNGENVGNAAAIAIYGGLDNRFHDLVVFNNDISAFGNDFDDVNPADGVSSENDYHGVIPRSNVDRVWILRNKIYNLGGDSVQVGIASTADVNRPSYVYIADNDFYSNLENGVDVKEANNTLIINNRIWDWKKHKNNSSTGGAIIIHNGANNTWVINNEVSDAASGIAATDSSLDTWVIGNVIKNVQHPDWDVEWAGGLYDSGMAIHFRGGSSGGAINNTIINYDKGIEAATGEYVYINNILFNRNSEMGNDLFVESTQSSNLVNNNVVYSKSVSLKQTNVTCVACLYEDPLFSDLSQNVSLASNSAAIGAGFNIQSYLDKYKDVFGVELTQDIYKGKRVVGGIDIGAMEDQDSQSGGGQEKPLSPEIINIEVN
ncbi:right-handed parallel beta-helix repeat-containing protein [Psychromonas sp. MME2]|uniref:right-handed parallel beta-helix repeat-containing protein n=1 Tax=unclassified Psychromonas TaxID=2614957 RepID=UPI00339CAB64